MKWILCYLTPTDNVIFKTDMSDHAEYMQYDKFIAFIFPYVSGLYSNDFLENLNRYLTLFIDTENKQWEVYKKKYPNVSFDTLLDFNTKREERKTQDKFKSQFGNIGLYKNTIENIFNKKHDRQNNNRQKPGESLSSFFNRTKRDRTS